MRGLPRGYLGEVIGRQLFKSGASIGANYREANRANSRADFTHKVNLAEKEAAETLYWLELCEEAGLGNLVAIRALKDEAQQLLAILVTIGRKSKK